MHKPRVLQKTSVFLGIANPFMKIALALHVAAAVLKVGKMEHFIQCQFNKEMSGGREWAEVQVKF